MAEGGRPIAIPSSRSYIYQHYVDEQTREHKRLHPRTTEENACEDRPHMSRREACHKATNIASLVCHSKGGTVVRRPK